MLLILAFIFIACTPRPEAVGSASAVVGQAPLTVTFTNSSANADQFRWDFGDGTALTTGIQETTVIHEYSKAGTYSATLTAFQAESPEEQDTITFPVTVEPGPLDHVSLEPTTPEVQVAQSLQLTATAFDQFDNEIPGLTFEWNASTAGIIEPTGTFKAGVAAGTFPDAVQVHVAQGAIQASATATIQVSPGALDHIVSGPDSVELDIGESRSFTAKGFDQFDNEIPGLTFDWEVTGGVGRLSSDGRFTAGTKAGTFPETIQVKATHAQAIKSTSSQVSIRPGPLRAVEVNPTEVTLQVMEQQRFTARSLDQFGNEIPQLALTWIAGASGQVDPEGRFTAGTKASTFEDGVVAEVSQGSASARSAARVMVKPGPLAIARVEPADVVLDIGASQPFLASAWDQFGNEISDALVSWSLVSDVGALDSHGVLESGTKAGAFPASISAVLVSGTKRTSATADVLIRPDPLEMVQITPAHAFVEGRATQQFSACLLDRSG